MPDIKQHSSTSNKERFVLVNRNTGMGLTGLAYNTASLLISTICDVEATPVDYSGANIEDITTLGVYETPSADCCRFKEVNAIKNPGLYEIQLADARYAVASSKKLVITVKGPTNLLDTNYDIYLTTRLYAGEPIPVEAGIDMYPTLAYADSYFATRLFTEPWDGIGDETKVKALIMATRALDRLSFQGYKTDPDQPLEFPRNGDDTPPAVILNATCEEALMLLSGENPAENANHFNITSESILSVRTTYDTERRPLWQVVGLTSHMAWTLIQPYLANYSTVKLIGG